MGTGYNFSMANGSSSEHAQNWGRKNNFLDGRVLKNEEAASEFWDHPIQGCETNINV